MVRTLLLISLFLINSALALAQQGEIQGKIIDPTTGEPLPFANVALKVGEKVISGAQTDFDGFYSIKPVVPGTYDVEFSFVGYQTQLINGVLVSSDQITFLDGKIQEKTELLDVVVVTEYVVPLLKADETSTGATVTKEDINNLPTRDVSSIVSNAAGVYQEDEGSSVNVKGSRSEATDYYIDGIKVRGTSAIPASAIEQLTVVTGGVPARYGDATGGIINITTRGPSGQFAGGIELITSKFLDPYGYNLANFSLSGPLLTIGKNTDQQKTILGFFLSGEYRQEKDDDPSTVGIWKAKDDVLDRLVNNPLVGPGELLLDTDGDGELEDIFDNSEVFQRDIDFLTKDDFEKIDTKPSSLTRNEVAVAGKLDFQPAQNITFTLGGTYNYRTGGTSFYSNAFRDFMRRYELYNGEHIPQNLNNVYRVYGRFTQRFGGAKKSNASAEENGTATISPIQNAFYSVQFDYTKSKSLFQDPTFQDNFFDYGYVGQFNTFRAPIYTQGTVGNLTGWELQGFQDTLVTFAPSNVNPAKSNHTAQYFDLAGDDRARYYSTKDQILANNGLINGNSTASLGSAYSLWNVPGTPYDTYDQSDNEQYRLTFNGSFDVKKAGASERNKHEIQFGFEYEQRIDRRYAINPVGLWNLMDDLVASFENGGIVRDLDNPILVINGEEIAFSDYDPENSTPFNSFQDSIKYNLTAGGSQSNFDRNFRDRFGFSRTDLVDVDNIDPNDYSLDMFSPDELYNGGGNASLVSLQYGYDHLGNKLTSNPAFEDFWTAQDANEEIFTRPVGAFRPVYMAGYIQDKFAFRDLIFNIGARVDRFDANQQVPKDLYVPLYGTRKANDPQVTSLLDGLGRAVPSTIGDDFVVYVDNEVNPTDVVGYRNGGVWYDRNGLAVKDPQQLGGSSTLKPYLLDPLSDNPADDIKNVNFDPSLGFEDYKPQVTFMPRIAFSFELSENAIFFAHYDILSQRPQSRLVTTPYDYYFFINDLTVKNNPNLKPEKTIDYQVGFKQKLGQTSALTISGFYRELRDMIQIINVPFAYPSTYNTFGNVDFATVKGFELSYDLRRTKNLRLTANYTLQFAEGTGSGDNSQANLIDFGQPNLRTIIPLSYDSRHMININADYRFADGKNYDGPKWFGKDIFANAGANLIIRARSGEPFTRQANPTPEAQFGVQSRGQLEGSINGSRLPWNFRVDGRVSKDFKLNFGSEPGKTDKYINVYLLVQNLLNTENVVGVYPFTASPGDDGYVNSAEGQEAISNVTDIDAFTDQYAMKVNDPNNYVIPRRMRLGVQFNF